MDHREVLAERPVEKERGFMPGAARTLIVVKSLCHPDFLIEVEGVAAV